MNKFFCSLLFPCFIYQSVSYAQNVATPKPQLVVGIVVDQMRWDYLYRYESRFGEHGFKRWMDKGFKCEQTFINHIPSYTAPGHAGIYTGSVPSVHGIAGNNWIDTYTGRNWYCVEDTLVKAVGGSQKAGRMSPRNLLTTTVTDELQLATNFQSKVVGISLKDRGSILPAGHLGKAYWYDDSTGTFISSSFYGEDLPGWLQQFNNTHHVGSYLNKNWETLYPISTYTSGLPDNNPYEGKRKNEKTPTFPHPVNAKDFSQIRWIPAGNTYTLDAAKAAIKGTNMGTDKITDFLCVSLSATDYIGHNYTIRSVEAEDCYLRLDKDIEEFLRFLDDNIGEGNYLIFLTADHGAAENALFLSDWKIPGKNQSEHQLTKDLTGYLVQKNYDEKLIVGVENYQITLNHSHIEEKGWDTEDIKDDIITWLYQFPQIAYVINLSEPEESHAPEMIKTKAIHGYRRGRSGDLLIINDPGWYYGYAPTGTTHSTWHPYDTHIPLIWYGWGIEKGVSYQTYYMEDISPTLSALLHIQMPNGCIGKVITEIFY